MKTAEEIRKFVIQQLEESQKAIRKSHDLVEALQNEWVSVTWDKILNFIDSAPSKEPTASIC